MTDPEDPMDDATDEPLRPIANGRGPKGTFAPGHGFARGPRNTRSAELRKAVLEEATDERVRAIIRKLMTQALQDGDVAAARLVLEHTIGKPTQALELSGPEGSSLGFGQVEAAIMAAVEPFGPGVKFALAAALRGVVLDARRDDGPDVEA